MAEIFKKNFVNPTKHNKLEKKAKLS